MELTGFAGQIIGWLILTIAYTTIILGLYAFVSWILIDIVITWVVRLTKNWKVIVQFIYYRKAFLRWYKENKDSIEDSE